MNERGRKRRKDRRQFGKVGRGERGERMTQTEERRKWLKKRGKSRGREERQKE